MTDGTQDSLNLFFACLYQRWKEVEIFGSRNQRIEKKSFEHARFSRCKINILKRYI